MKYTLSSALAVFALILAGCGILFLPATQTVSVDSNPVEATVTINGVNHGLTPIAVELDNKRSHTITIRKEGYNTVSCILNAKVKGSIVVLDVLGGLLPVLIDAATGGWKQLDKTYCNADLVAGSQERLTSCDILRRERDEAWEAYENRRNNTNRQRMQDTARRYREQCG